MHNKLVSVIIPAYNCAGIVSFAIESVFRQTYDNYELIIVDDGSTDNTSEIVMKYGKDIKYIYQENGGVSKARNTGIEHAGGRYISFLDADDVWESNKLDIQMRCFQEHHDVKMIFSSFRHKKYDNILYNRKYEETFNVFREYKCEIDDFFENRSFKNHSDARFDFYWGNIYKYLFLGNFILPSSVIFRKEALNDVGLLNEDYRVAEETEFFLRFSKEHRIGFINYPLLYYELPDPDNLSGKKNTERLMKNALRIQIDSILGNLETYQKDMRFFLKGISMTYARLAYYYLSEGKLLLSRKYAKYSIGTNKRNLMPYGIFLATFLPEDMLKKAADLKKRRRNLSGST